MHGLADGVVAAKREGNVADAAAHFAVGKRGLDLARGLDVTHRVIPVLFDSGGHGEDVGVKDDVAGIHAHFFGEDAVGARADLHAALRRVRLPGLIEGHHHHAGAVALDQSGALLENLFALLEADGIDDALALNALQPRLNDAPLRAVDHDGDAGDVRLRSDVVQEGGHRLLGIQHGFVHVDVDDLRATLHLLLGDAQALLELAAQNQLGEFGRAGHVGAFADVDEIGFRADHQRFQAAEAGVAFDLGGHARRKVLHRLANGANMSGRRPAASADDVHPAVRGELAQIR